MPERTGIIITAEDRTKEGTAKASKSVDAMKAKMGQARDESGKFQKASGGVKQSLISQASSTGLASSKLGMLATALANPITAAIALASAIAAIAAAWINAAFETAAFGDALAKTSKKLGVTTEYLQEIRLAAQYAGVGVSQAETAIKMLQRSSAEAASGNKEYKDSFDALGVSVTDAAGNLRPVEELMPEIAEAMKGVSSAGERTKIAMDLMGRAGSEMIPMLLGGAAAFEKAATESERLGTMSSETAAMSEEMTDVMLELKLSVEGLWHEMGDDLIPMIIELGRVATDVFVFMRKHWEDMKLHARIALGVLTLGTSELIGATAGLIVSEEEEADAKKKQIGAAMEFDPIIIKGTANAKDNADAIKKAARAHATYSQEIGKLNKQIAEHGKTSREVLEMRAEEIALDMALIDATGRLTVADERRLNVLEKQSLLVMMRIEADEVAMAEATGAKLLAIDEQVASEKKRIWDADLARNQKTIDAEVKARTKANAKVMAQQREQAEMAAVAVRAYGNAVAEVAVAAIQDQENMAKVMAQSTVKMIKTIIMAYAASAAVKQLDAHAFLPFIGIAVGTAAAGVIFAVIESFLADVPAAQFGGMVTGGVAGRDSVMAMLTPGEVVVPAPVVRQLAGAAPSDISTRPDGGRTTIMQVGLLEIPSRARTRRLLRDLGAGMREIDRRGQLLSRRGLGG